MRVFNYNNRYDLFILKGSAFKIEFKIMKNDEESFNLSGWTVRFTCGNIIKTSNDPSEIEITNPSQGEGIVYMQVSDSNQLTDGAFYVIDLYRTDEEIYPFVYGRFRIEQKY